jgi:hypothetical protein
MSKTNTSKLDPATQVHELRDDELQHVSAGLKYETEVTDFVGRALNVATGKLFELNTFGGNDVL